MTNEPTHNTLAYTGIALAVFAPRYWRRWLLTNIVLVFLFFASLGHYGDPQSDDVAEFDRTGTYLTAFSWLVLVVFLVTFVYGIRVCWAKSRRYADEGTPLEEASPYQRVTGSHVAPAAPAPAVVSVPTPAASAPVAPARPRLVVVTPLGTRKARSVEEHEGFDAVDRRRFAHLVD